MNIVEKRLDELQPYENNPRNNDRAVPYVAESIRRYGFKVPIVIDKNGVIVAGHTRYLASMELGLDTVPCVIADDLNDDEIKEYRLVDNKVSEYSSWDFVSLEEELAEIDFEGFDFGFPDLEIDWDNVDDLSEETYEEPPKDMLVCPKCHHVDSAVHFKKVSSEE